MPGIERDIKGEIGFRGQYITSLTELIFKCMDDHILHPGQNISII